MQTLFSRSPWERASVVEAPFLGQTQAGCEPTPEGGQRCADGTYIPPGCGTGSPETVKGTPLIQPFPVVPVALAVAGVSAAAAIFLSGDRRMGAPPDYPSSAFARLEEVSRSIKAERAADSWNHAQAIKKTKENFDLLEQQRVAEIALVEENRLWEATHRNAESLQAAQAKVDAIAQQRAQVENEANDYRGQVSQNAQNILYFRQQAMEIIATMPEAYQADARRKIDPCYQETAMKGAFLGQVPMANRFSWNRAPNVYRPGSQYQLYAPRAQEMSPMEAVEGGDCYTCSNGSDIRQVPANQVAALRNQGYVCRRGCDSSYGAGPLSSFNGFGDMMMTGAPFTPGGLTPSMTTQVTSYGGAMMGQRYPVVNR